MAENYGPLELNQGYDACRFKKELKKRKASVDQYSSLGERTMTLTGGMH